MKQYEREFMEAEEPSRYKRFIDRIEAGRVLATRLAAFANRRDVLVLALPRGGIPVGAEVARALHASLDVLVVRKLGIPWEEELAMGAIATGGFACSTRMSYACSAGLIGTPIFYSEFRCVVLRYTLLRY